MIYLDYTANTPADPAVLEVFLQTEKTYIGNPNSSHPAGIAAREKLGEITDSIARMLGIKPTEIIYTSGASEANNLAVKGIAGSLKSCGKHIITTALEHPSVLGPVNWLREVQGFETDTVNIKPDGRIDEEHLKSLLREDTTLVAITAVDSELGVIQNVQEIADIVHKYPGCRLHVDATQAVGKIPFSFQKMDTVSLTGHKFFGLNGCGLLYKQKDVKISPLIHGRTDTANYRSGTPTLALAASLETALEISLKKLNERATAVRYLNEKLRKAFANNQSITINSPRDAVPHILNISVSGIKGTRMQKLLAEHGVCVSVKSACSADGTMSKAVYAICHDQRNALSSWRVSLSHLTTEKEIDTFLEIMDLCIREAKN